ncbi:MAG: hypothetical protein WCK89_03375 [bacterium]
MPNLAAPAAAAWGPPQGPSDFDTRPVVPQSAGKAAGATGGSVATFAAPAEGTEEDPVYQSVRYHVASYKLEIPNGSYAVKQQDR